MSKDWARLFFIMRKKYKILFGFVFVGLVYLLYRIKDEWITEDNSSSSPETLSNPDKFASYLLAQKIDKQLLDLTSIKDRLETLEYIPVGIISFTNNVLTAEKGQVVSLIQFNFQVSGNPTSLSIDNGVGSVSGSSKTVNVNVSTNTTYRLTASDGKSTDSATTTIQFLNKVYWGTSANQSLNNGEVNSLSGQMLSSSKNRAINVNGNGQYIYYCYPASWGDAIFTIGGLVNSAFTKTIQNITNQYGDVTSYAVWRSNTIQNGNNMNIQIS